MNLSITCQRLAGRVAYFLPNWEVLTQDQWVLQTMAGANRDSKSGLSAPPDKIFSGWQEPDNLGGSWAFVQRGSGGDTSLFKELPVTNVPCRKEGWPDPERSQPICEDKTLQNGRSLLAPIPPTVTGMDGKAGLERCIPSSPHPSRLSTPPSIPMGGAYLLAYKQHPVFTKLQKPVVDFLI